MQEEKNPSTRSSTAGKTGGTNGEGEELQKIGRPGKPVRALTFAGGGFSTALQLGVAHALLVSRGRAPDVVVGISAGAINAVALAEILQAGGREDDDEKKLARRIVRFREIFEAYRTIPGELLSDLLPDALQIDTSRPLKPLELPIHFEAERDGRQESLHSRSGLMNVYNQLLDLRLSVGTLTRILRRVLGIRDAGAIHDPKQRRLVRRGERLRMLTVLGSNLHRLTPLVPQLLGVTFTEDPRPPEGRSAGALISRNRFLASSWRALKAAASLFGLAVVWVLAILMLGAATLFAWLQFRESRALRAALSLSAGLVLPFLAWAAIFAAPLVLLDLVGLWSPAGILLVCALLYAPCVVLAWTVYRRREKLLNHFLRRNAIAGGLLDPHPLRRKLVDLFNPRYYGKLDLETVAEHALGDTPTPLAGEGSEVKKVADYAREDRKPPISVAVAAAEVASGSLETLPEDQPVVDSLLAATAVAPFFPPQRIPKEGNELYVDGSNVANEPTLPLLKYVRRRTDPDAIVHMYCVSPLPISQPKLQLKGSPGQGRTGSHWPLVDVVTRALQLQRFRDASLERRLTEIVTQAMPSVEHLENYDGEAFPYRRTWVYPIEPQEPNTANERLLESGTEDERRRLIAQTVADGCRTALEAMIQPAIRAVTEKRADGTWIPAPCREAVARHLAAEKVGSAALPGNDPVAGPGLAEVCRHCVVFRRLLAVEGEEAHRFSLVPRDESFSPPRWPVEDTEVDTARDRPLERPGNEHQAETRRILQEFREDEEREPWPVAKGGRSGAERPTVSLLFSGGVFRGVFQVGVLNALSEMGLRPDIVAGASVGSITAAMVARIFADAPGAEEETKSEADRLARAKRIRRLAAAYQVIDRLVLTDRFADFVRSLTVRAGETRFSLRQVDQVFRQYDRTGLRGFERTAREVVAGLERLLYLSPFELKDLASALRTRDSAGLIQLLKEHFQELLERGGVASEILGAEPLALLIQEYVLREGEATPDLNPLAYEFDTFLKQRGILFLATATNLTQGRLEILGEHQLGGAGDPEKRISILQGLLASGAFPGVFRPRWSWEVMPLARTTDLFTDGGVMDNLPLDAVTHFLVLAADAELVRRRPTVEKNDVPHLLLCTSLEADPGTLEKEDTQELEEDWPALLSRTKKLGYNQKLETFAGVQHAIRKMYRPRTGAMIEPLDLEVVTILPKWLCGTFAFHPMLGFRREKQARSIAHGCASTLVKLGSLGETHGHWLEAWGVRAEQLPAAGTTLGSKPPGQKEKGGCWWRPGCPCPFSKEHAPAGEKNEAGEGKSDQEGRAKRTADELDRIYRLCREAKTHQGP